MPLSHAGFHAEPLDDAQAAMVAISQPALVSTALEKARDSVRKTLRRRLQKLGRKVEHLNRDREKLKSYTPYQRYGTLLLTQRLPRGSTCATVTDYYSPQQETICIPLDPRLSLNDNAQVYFKKYRKTKTGLSKIETLLQECAAEEQYLEGLAHQAVEAEDWPTLEAIEAELGDSRRAGPTRPSIRPRSAAAQPYRTFALSGGYVLYCGKSNHGNDALVRQIAEPDDLWFHARGAGWGACGAEGAGRCGGARGNHTCRGRSGGLLQHGQGGCGRGGGVYVCQTRAQISRRAARPGAGEIFPDAGSRAGASRSARTERAGRGDVVRYAIISDLHANLEALQAVLGDALPKVDAVVCLGDIVGYKRQPARMPAHRPRDLHRRHRGQPRSGGVRRAALR